MLNFFEVIWVFDRSIRPPNPKMYVCLSYEDGWFLRINTSDKFRPCVAIPQPTNVWLKHDSHIECALLEVDEFEIDEYLMTNQPIGSVDRLHADEVYAKLINATYLRASDKLRLGEIFGK